MFPNQKNSASQSRLCRGALIGLLAGSISGAFAFDSFETPSPTWQVRDHDGPLRVLRHQRVFDQAHSGSGSEFVEFEAEQGTYVHLAHSIRPSLIHADLRPHLWVRAERPGARLAARVVLPHTKDQRTGQPRSLLVHGNSYALTGQWQQLVVSEIPTRLQRQLRALRAQTQQPWDDREAYIDMVVVNAYQGPRLNRIWLDDLDVRGHVESQTPALASAYRSQRTTVEVRGDTLLLDQAPRFLRIARYRGEPLHVFRDLGFNAVYTDLAATEDLLANAHANGLWVIAAPPSKPLGPIAGQLIAWTTGPLVGEAMAETAAARAAAARRAKPANRPVVGDFLRIDREAAVNTDILLIGDVARNNAVDARRYQDFLRRQSTQGRLKMPLWARLELDPSPTWRRQLEALGLDSPQRLLPSLQQIRAEAFAAATAGARGILIDTRAPLSAAVSDPRAALVFLLNAELATLEPWFAGGVASRLHQADPDWQVTQIATARSRLLIGLRYGPQQQLLDPMLPRERLTLVSPPIAGAGRGFRVSRGRLESMISRRVPGGDQVR